MKIFKPRSARRKQGFSRNAGQPQGAFKSRAARRKQGFSRDAGQPQGAFKSRTVRRKLAPVLTGLAALCLLLAFFAIRYLLSGTPVSPVVAGALQAEAAGDTVMAGASGDLTVRFIDVGQGMAALIECGGHYMAIDGGGRESSSKFVAVLKAQGVEKLDYVVVSHYDEDHLAGLIGALHVFPTDRVLAPDYRPDTAIFRSYEKMRTEEGVPAEVPSPGSVYSLGTAAFQIVSPSSGTADLENDRSLMVLLTNGTHRFLFPGDAEAAGEAAALATGFSLRADVLSAPHHGSNTSSTEAFLDAVSPKLAIVSAGADNPYHHPHPSILARYRDRGIEVYRTDESGTITVTSRGGKLTVDTEK